MTEAQAMNELAGRIGEVATSLERLAGIDATLPSARQILLRDLSLIAAGFAQQEDMTPDSAANKALLTYRCLLVHGGDREGAMLASLMEKVAI